MAIKFPKLILSIGICLGAGVLGSVFTVSSIPTWYATLNKPVFSPPNWIFAPVWTILYILIGISLYLVWVKKNPSATSTALSTSSLRIKVPTVFWVQLILNAVWSMIFFGLKNPTLALVDVIALWIAIFLTIKSFHKINKFAANLLIPYLAWVSFATILNIFIVLLNP
ncbi:tryptophan-rich sensory protein [Candidatus Daviesbacteria bacterium]|nr:tryptophan-rich sensory protein [Candidatus Daviesbacteria bacterium]